MRKLKRFEGVFMTFLVNSTAIECAKAGVTSYALSSSLEKTFFYVTQTAFWSPLNQINELACSKIYSSDNGAEKPKKGWIDSIKAITGAKKIQTSDELRRVLCSTTIAAALYIPATLLTQELLRELGFQDTEEVNQSLELHVISGSAWAGGMAIGTHLLGCLLERLEKGN